MSTISAVWSPWGPLCKHWKAALFVCDGFPHFDEIESTEIYHPTSGLHSWDWELWLHHVWPQVCASFAILYISSFKVLIKLVKIYITLSLISVFWNPTGMLGTRETLQWKWSQASNCPSSMSLVTSEWSVLRVGESEGERGHKCFRTVLVISWARCIFQLGGWMQSHNQTLDCMDW